MKSTFQRVCIAVMSLCLSVSLFACGSNSMELTPEAKRIVSTDDIKFIGNDGKATFNIVRADGDNETAGPVAVEIFKKYKEFYGVTPKQLTDLENGTDKREILIGECDRDATKNAKKLLELDGTGKDSDYIICSVGDDIVIYGNCTAALTAAGTCFVEKFLSKSQEGGIYYHHRGDEDGLKLCSISNISKFTVVRPIYNVSYLTQCETEKLTDVLYQKTGYSVPIIHDNVSIYREVSENIKGVLEPTETTEYEIIIGNCDRKGVKQIDIAYNYEIRIEDTKIYLNGGSPYATTMAVSEFTKMVQNNSAIDSSMSVLNGNYNNSVKAYDTKSYYRPTWWDEFNGTEINTGNWRVAWDARGGTAVDGRPCYRGSSVLNKEQLC